MFDLKAIEVTLSQLEEERGVKKEHVIEAIEYALAAAYKKDFGKKGQIVRAHINMETGESEFEQVKIVVIPSMLKPELGEDEEPEEEPTKKGGKDKDIIEEPEEGALIRFNPEHHILLEDALIIKNDAKADEEIIFPLEPKDDFGRVAAQTAKQVIVQRIREAEKITVLEEFGQKQGEVVNGTVQRVERGNVFIDLGKTVAILPYDEQIRGEHFKQGERVRAYLFLVEESPRGINLKLSRSHPKFIEKLFEIEAPEIAGGVVEIKSIAREAGSRSKIAVMSNDELVDPVGSCVGQRGVRVTTIMSELGGEKIDIIEWSEDPINFIEDALSPAKVKNVSIDEDEHLATIEVNEDQLSLAIGKGGQNVRLAAKLTGWKIDIKGIGGNIEAEVENDGSITLKEGEETEAKEDEADNKVPEEIPVEANPDNVSEKEVNTDASEDEELENLPENIEEEIQEEAEKEKEDKK